MTMLNRLALSLLGAIALGAIALAWREYRIVQDLRAEGLTADERARLQKVAWDAERQVQTLKARLGAASAAVHRASEEDSGSVSMQTRTLGEAAEAWFNQMDDPTIQRLRDAQRIALINRAFGAFFRNAHLSPQQISAFQRLMMERWDAQTDVILAATRQGINPLENPQEFRTMVRNAQNEVDRQIQSTLGPDLYSQFQNYQRTQGQRNVVGQLQQDLTFTDAPLSPTQTQQMAQIMTQSNPKGGGAVTNRTLQLAQTVLSPSQIQALRNIQQLQQANRQLQQALSQSRAAGLRPPGG
jgi:hypothetical protein